MRSTTERLNHPCACCCVTVDISTKDINHPRLFGESWFVCWYLSVLAHNCIKNHTIKQSTGTLVGFCTLLRMNKAKLKRAKYETGSKQSRRTALDILSQHPSSCSWWEEEKCCLALSPISHSHSGTLRSLLIRGNNYQSGQVIKLKHKWLHELGWLYYKVFPGLIKEKYGSAHPQCHRAGKNEKKAPATKLE